MCLQRGQEETQRVRFSGHEYFSLMQIQSFDTELFDHPRLLSKTCLEPLLTRLPLTDLGEVRDTFSLWFKDGFKELRASAKRNVGILPKF